MIAVWSPRVARWRSRQEAEAFSVPSSNHLIATSPVKLVFLIFVGGLIQAMRFACSAQNPSGSRAACSYICAVAFRVDMRVGRDLRTHREQLAFRRDGYQAWTVSSFTGLLRGSGAGILGDPV